MTIANYVLVLLLNNSVSQRRVRLSACAGSVPVSAEQCLSHTLTVRILTLYLFCEQALTVIQSECRPFAVSVLAYCRLTIRTLYRAKCHY